MKTLIIMRGLPGSGKSTRALNLQPDRNLHCSADDWFMQDGKYNFDPEKLHLAHGYCARKAELFMQRGATPVVIDNTNIKKRDFKNYLDLAAKYGYEVRYETSSAPWAWDVEECAKRNVHCVPKEVIQRMKDAFQP